MKTAMAENEETFGGRAKESVTGWWGRSRRFLAEVRNEMGRVTWPNRKETLGTTGVVLVLVFIISAYLGLVDYILSHIVRYLID